MPLKHTAALRVRGDEYLVKTCDLSEDGVGLHADAEHCPAEPGDAVEVDVLFGTVLKTFRGVVASAEVLGESQRLGICFGNGRAVWPSAPSAATRKPEAQCPYL